MFTFFKTRVKCPLCGDHNSECHFFTVSCLNTKCKNFDPLFVARMRNQPALNSKDTKKPSFENNRSSFSNSSFGSSIQSNSLEGRDIITLKYKNHKNEEKNYEGDLKTLRQKGTFVTLNLSPSGKKCAFKISKILNFNDIETHFRKFPPPTPQEESLLKFHLNRGSTSEKFEVLRKKYPHFRI